jgi:hypothetical protein
MKEEAIIKMEFLLTLNDNIVVQRFYNVRNFNPQARHSYDLPYYMMDNQEAIYLDPEILNTSNTDDPENFNMYVKLADDVIFHRIFDGKLYPPKVRYTVDVRPSLKNILKGLTDIFSAENLCYDYMDYDLSR